MPTKAFYWQLYISTYTALLGIPLLFFPKSVIPMMGFDPSMVDEGPFVRLTGMFLLGLTLITFRVWQKKTEEMVLGTVILRTLFIITLLVLGITEGFPFLYIMAGVVGFGMIGTLWALGRGNILRYL